LPELPAPDCDLPNERYHAPNPVHSSRSTKIDSVFLKHFAAGIDIKRCIYIGIARGFINGEMLQRMLPLFHSSQNRYRICAILRNQQSVPLQKGSGIMRIAIKRFRCFI